MDQLKRRQKIKALLAGWFESEGWGVREGVASWFVQFDDCGEEGEVVVDLTSLADSLESQIERALA